MIVAETPMEPLQSKTSDLHFNAMNNQAKKSYNCNEDNNNKCRDIKKALNEAFPTPAPSPTPSLVQLTPSNSKISISTLNNEDSGCYCCDNQKDHSCCDKDNELKNNNNSNSSSPSSSEYSHTTTVDNHSNAYPSPSSTYGQMNNQSTTSADQKYIFNIYKGNTETNCQSVYNYTSTSATYSYGASSYTINPTSNPSHIINFNTTPTPQQLAAAAAHGSFSHQSLSRNGFATGPYFRYWQDLFDLRPGRLIFSLTLVYEILGKDKTPSFLMAHFDDKFDWIHPAMPLGSLYSRAIGPKQPPSTVEMMYTCGAQTWRTGDAAYLMKFTRAADTYVKELGINACEPNEELDLQVLIRAVWAIINS